MSKLLFASFCHLLLSLDHCLLIRPSCLDEYPNITEWVKGMKSLPGVAEYLNERPQVGTDKLGRPDTYIRGSKS